MRGRTKRLTVAGACLVAVAVAGAHAVGALSRRWSGRAALAAHVGALTLLLAETVGGHTAYGIPTPATFTALGRAIGRAPEASTLPA